MAALAEQMGCSKEEGSGFFGKMLQAGILAITRYDPYTPKLEIPKRHVGKGLLLVAAFPWMELRSIPCTPGPRPPRGGRGLARGLGGKKIRAGREVLK